MPKGYGYDEAPKKAAAFKMKGYSYPGESPAKLIPGLGKTKWIDKVRAFRKAFVAGATATDQGINKAISTYRSEKRKAREDY